MLNRKEIDQLLRRASSNDESKIYISVDERLTPDFLLESVTPFVNTLSKLQHIVDELKGARPSRIHISTLVDNGKSDLLLAQHFEDGDEDVSGLLLALEEFNENNPSAALTELREEKEKFLAKRSIKK